MIIPLAPRLTDAELQEVIEIAAEFGVPCREADMTRYDKERIGDLPWKKIR